MVSFSTVAIGGVLRSRLRRKVTPSATHPGGKYVAWNVFKSTVLENFSCSVLTMVARVKGQRVATNATAAPITTSANNAPILIQRENTFDLRYQSAIHRID